jgi:LAS superfamily LD-carboxypeptidase LdcB
MGGKGRRVRVIEPVEMKRRSIKKKKRSRKPFWLLLLLAAIAGAGWYYIQPEKLSPTSPEPNREQQKAEASTAPARSKMRTFTNEQFVSFYSSFAYPNTDEITSPPVITGNAAADARIRMIAEKRGYKLRSVPVSSPEMLPDGYELQQKALQPLVDMQAAARRAGYTLELTAAFRSIETQRELFLSRLSASPAAIADGTADDAVNQTLTITAPPGYSRHHNGFTVDFSCGTVGGVAFLNSSCYAWMSKDNFANAKNYGWIPSYPEGAHATGPEPEPWEFVWVGRSSLLE